MDMQPIEASRTLSVTLTAEQLEVVLRHLDMGQHRLVRQIIDSLMAQVERQSRAPLNVDDIAGQSDG